MGAGWRRRHASERMRELHAGRRQEPYPVEVTDALCAKLQPRTRPAGATRSRLPESTPVEGGRPDGHPQSSDPRPGRPIGTRDRTQTAADRPSRRQTAHWDGGTAVCSRRPSGLAPQRDPPLGRAWTSILTADARMRLAGGAREIDICCHPAHRMPGSPLAIWRPSPGAGGYEGELDEKLRQNYDASEIREPPGAEKLAEEVPDEASGEDDTLLGDTDQHSEPPRRTEPTSAGPPVRRPGRPRASRRPGTLARRSKPAPRTGRPPPAAGSGSVAFCRDGSRSTDAADRRRARPANPAVARRCRRLTHGRPSVHDTGRSAEPKVRRFVGGVKRHGGNQPRSERQHGNSSAPRQLTNESRIAPSMKRGYRSPARMPMG
jgi:hypothetical protein